MDKPVFYLDATPTWQSLIPVLTEVAVNGTTSEGRRQAEEGLRRMAQLADRWRAWSREGV